MVSIASAIELKQQQVANAYLVVSNKGGTLPVTQNLENLSSAIETITTGTSAVLIDKTFTGNGTYRASSYNADGFSQVIINVPGSTLVDKTITENGTYYASSDNADGFRQVTVNVSVSSFDIPREISNSGVYQVPSNTLYYTIPTGVIDLGDNVLRYAFCGSSGIELASFSGLEYITGNNALQMAFANCTNLTQIVFSDLRTDFFGQNISQNQFTDMLLGVTGCTVRFPSTLENIINSWTDVLNGFGGTDTTILYDADVQPGNGEG